MIFTIAILLAGVVIVVALFAAREKSKDSKGQ